MIHTQNLGRRFDTDHGIVEAVRGVDIDVADGEIVAVLGPNGAGKSTTLHMLTTLLPPTFGTATVAGMDVGVDPIGVRRRIGYIGQGNGSSDGLRVNEELVGQARLHGVDRKTAQRRSGALLERLQLHDLARRDVATLSGGQRRRLDVAMGLIHEPSLVFLDEPSAGLDPQSRSNLWEHIERLPDEGDTTIVLTTHYLDEADAVADRVIVIDHGSIIADGTPDQLKSGVSGDLVSLELTDTDAAEPAAQVAKNLPGADEVTVDITGATSGAVPVVYFRIDRGDTVTPEIVRALDSAGIGLRSVQARRPTLDDVFLSLTGRSLREDETA